MHEDSEQQQIERLESELSRLKRHLYWIYAALACFVLLSIIPGGTLLALLILFIGVPSYLLYLFLRGLALRRARINERLASGKPYHKRGMHPRQAG